MRSIGGARSTTTTPPTRAGRSSTVQPTAPSDTSNASAAEAIVCIGRFIRWIGGSRDPRGGSAPITLHPHRAAGPPLPVAVDPHVADAHGVVVTGDPDVLAAVPHPVPADPDEAGARGRD